MKLIDIDRYLKDLLSAYDDVSMEFEVLDRQPLVSAIPIPEGATNGDVIKIMFPNAREFVLSKSHFMYDGLDYAKEFRKDWWNAPYRGNLSEKPTGSESEEKNDRVI